MLGGSQRFFSSTILAFLCGIVSCLYVPTPVGHVAMLDMAAYVLAPPLFFTSYHTYPKHLRRLLILACLWIANGLLSDMWRNGLSFSLFKPYMILVDSVALIVVGAWISRKTPIALPWFIMGASISSVISLYHFQNGALLAFAAQSGFDLRTGDLSEFLIDKQIYPIWVTMFFMVGAMGLRLVLKLPWVFCILGTFFCGMFLLVNGGSRSTCLIFVSTGGLIALFEYKRDLFFAIFKRKVLTTFCVLIAAIVFNAVYVMACKKGLLGEEGYAKYRQKLSGESGLLDNRNDILVNWPFLWRSPFIGAGTNMRDRWGYMDRSPYLPHTNVNGAPKYYSYFMGHSCIVYAWTAHGIFGLIFWAYVLWLIFDFMGDKVVLLGDAGPFILFALVDAIWSVLFSPYGGFRGKIMFIAAFLALAKDPRFLMWLAQCNRVRIQNLRIKAWGRE